MRARLYTIPPSAPFLTSLAKALLNGNLPSPGGTKPDPLSLPLTTIYLPTRRAQRALRQAFLDAAGGKAMLLPRIRALGDPDEEQALILAAEIADDDLEAHSAAPAIGALPRRLALMRLIFAWLNALRERHLSPGPHHEPALQPDMSAAQCSALAGDLARLMDLVEQEEVDLSALNELTVPADLADHWANTVDFLKIVTEHWPNYLRDNGLVSAVAQRNALMEIEAARLEQGLAPGPVIAAGSTGTIPATARLLKVIASLPNGAVVLPGLDLELDNESWGTLAERPEHPQAGMAELLRKLEATRQDVGYVAGTEPRPPEISRLALISEVLRPASSTDRWRDYLRAGEPGIGQELDLFGDEDDQDAAVAPHSLVEALDGLHLIEAPTQQDEAEAIALILRFSLETPKQTAALITPDRLLARRVAARLKGFGIEIDDSAGLPLQRSVPGSFLDLILSAFAENFAPPELMALLKHPLTLLGRSPGEIRVVARLLERAVFRDVYVGEGLGGVKAALAGLQSGTKPHARALREADYDAVLRLIGDLESAFAPLGALTGAPSNAAKLAEAHAAVAEALALDHRGSASRLWGDEAGEAFSILLAQLIDAGGSLAMRTADYPSFYRTLVSGQVIRPRRSAHPRLSIWGPLEARLQQPDVVILGSLNEGVWPRPQDTGPWLSRQMRNSLGLPPPERRIGLSAHDFAQSIGARRVYLTRALKVDGVPGVPSRWLMRLQALVKAAGLAETLSPPEPWIEWARLRDRTQGFAPVSEPKPCPPIEARPSQLSVTGIERWIANPYEIFARDILKLRALKPLGTEPDAASQGSLIHSALHDFALAYPRELPADAAEALIAFAERHFQALGGSARVDAFWRPRFERFARWFAATEPGRRAQGAELFSEVEGAIDLDGSFRLTARADRIDLAADGSLTIYDYKSGRPPISKHVDELFAPQLPLEAAIAGLGGFGELGKRSVAALCYIKTWAPDDGGEESPAGTKTAESLGAAALGKLRRLVARYGDPGMPYEVKRRKGPLARRYDEYEHLARVKEWLTEDAEEDWA